MMMKIRYQEEHVSAKLMEFGCRVIGLEITWKNKVLCIIVSTVGTVYHLRSGSPCQWHPLNGIFANGFYKLFLSGRLKSILKTSIAIKAL